MRKKSSARAIPGAIELLAELKRAGIRTGIATSSENDVLNDTLERLQISAFIDATVTAGEVANPKPSPDCYLRLVSLLNVDPVEVAVVEDTEVGVRAARAARLRTIALRHALNRHMTFSDASDVVDSFYPIQHTIDILRGAS